ncbi:hypothetical protein ABIB87_008922 [Bradyrhizobium sp. JR18.2]
MLGILSLVMFSLATIQIARAIHKNSDEPMAAAGMFALAGCVLLR